MIRVMVVAASPVVRAGLSAVLTSNPRLTVVGSVSDLDALLEEVGQLQPQVVLLDLSGNFQQSVWEKLLSMQEEQYSSPIIVIADQEAGGRERGAGGKILEFPCHSGFRATKFIYAQYKNIYFETRKRKK